MKRSITLLLLTAIAVYGQVNAQSKQVQKLLPPPANIIIDGNLTDWGDSLRYHNQEKNLNYTLANDHDNIYAVIKISDRLEQARVLNAGITLSIDTRGKKKETFTMTFPLRYPGSPAPSFNQHKDDGEITKEEREELLRERITTLRSIKVTGFKDIEGDMITTSNTYGIKAAINYDADGNLVYETAIPVKFFHADDPAKSEWAFNFKINRLQKPERTTEGGEMQGKGGMGGGRGGMSGGGGMGGGRGGRGGRGGGMGRGPEGTNADRGEIFKSIDFWEKYTLNQK